MTEHTPLPESDEAALAAYADGRLDAGRAGRAGGPARDRAGAGGRAGAPAAQV